GSAGRCAPRPRTPPRLDARPTHGGARPRPGTGPRGGRAPSGPVPPGPVIASHRGRRVCAVDSARDVLIALARRYAFGDVGALARAVLPDGEPARRVAAVCEFGHRLLTLDAE